MMGFWNERPATETVSRLSRSVRISAPNAYPPVVLIEVVHRSIGDSLRQLALMRGVEEERRVVDVGGIAHLDEHRRHVGRHQYAERPLLDAAIERRLRGREPLLDECGELARLTQVLVLGHVIDDEGKWIFLLDM